jgi:glutamate racemase
MRIGVFDSGVGGLSVARAIQKSLPDDEILYRNDREHIPYGDKTAEELLGLVLPILQQLIDDGCGVIVIACNSVTTNLISDLRKKLSVPLVGMEPMVKPAAEQTSSGVIAVCATPATLRSQRYQWLKHTYAKKINVLEPNCAGWAAMIERRQVDQQKIRWRIEEVLEKGADQIVLGCTHYHWIEKEITRIAAGRAHILQPEQAVIQQLKRVLKTIGPELPSFPRRRESKLK